MGLHGVGGCWCVGRGAWAGCKAVGQSRTARMACSYGLLNDPLAHAPNSRTQFPHTRGLNCSQVGEVMDSGSGPGYFKLSPSPLTAAINPATGALATDSADGGLPRQVGLLQQTTKQCPLTSPSLPLKSPMKGCSSPCTTGLLLPGTCTAPQSA